MGILLDGGNMLGYFVRKKHVTIYKNNQNIQSGYIFILFCCSDCNKMQFPS